MVVNFNVSLIIKIEGSRRLGRAGKDQEYFSLPKKRAFQAHIHGNKRSETQQSNAAV